MSSPLIADAVIVGAGAAGLMCAIQAGRAAPAGTRIMLVDGARKPGAKILVAGGGRCNVTHQHVSEQDYAGGSANAIRRVLRRFSVPDTQQFFAELGVSLVEEETGKLFPQSNQARSVLDGLLHGAREAGVECLHPFRIESMCRDGAQFRLFSPQGEIRCRQLVLATGGRSLPKSGSDGGGYKLAQSVGHRLSERITPSLVPLTLSGEHWLKSLAGVTLPAELEVRTATGKRLTRHHGSTLLTHFGLSGPAVLDISRYWIAAQQADSNVQLLVNWLPGETAESLGQTIAGLSGRSVEKWLAQKLPTRLAAVLCAQAGLVGGQRADQLRREQRRALIKLIVECALPVTGDRGYNYAEVTAGGVPLDEIQLKSMASRRCDGLYLCGELLDVDGRIGGFNFQWAWASGSVAGWALAAQLALSH